MRLQLQARQFGESTAPPVTLLKVKDAKSGKTFTSHWRTNPKNYLTDTCLTCHPSSTEQQAKYGIESMCAHYQGKRSATPSSGSVEFIDRALALNANHPKALELAGSAEVEAGNLKAASRYWEALHDGLPSGSEVRRELVLAFERLRGAATQSIPSTPRVSAPAF